MDGKKLWTEEELELLGRGFPDIDSICKALPQRTRRAIASQCLKLGLRQKQIHFWTAAEISKLRRMYPSAPKDEICKTFAHSTWINIRQVARYHGIRRARKPYKPTGYAPLDQLRERCFELNYTMPDLDKISKTKRYFQKANWTVNKRINHKAVGRAIEALDGQIRAEWND